MDLSSQTLRPGDGPTSRPTPQSRVRVKTKGVLQEDGQVVDQHSSVRFTLGDGDVIQGRTMPLLLIRRLDKLSTVMLQWSILS